MNDAHEAPSASSWRRGAMAPVALAAACVALALWLQARIGFNLQDESFLWYGELRVLAGETPLRDFRSYDPGRYWWAAGWATILGDGLAYHLRTGKHDITPRDWARYLDHADRVLRR